MKALIASLVVLIAVPLLAGDIHGKVTAHGVRSSADAVLRRHLGGRVVPHQGRARWDVRGEGVAFEAEGDVEERGGEGFDGREFRDCEIAPMWGVGGAQTRPPRSLATLGMTRS